MTTFLVLIFIVSESCSPHLQRPQKNAELANQINEILDALEKQPLDERFFGYILDASGVHNAYNDSEVIAQCSDVRILIEHPDISLPLMFKRIEKLLPTSPTLVIYFVVFKYTKSPASIPYLADYFASCDEESMGRLGNWPSFFALMAAEEITFLKLTDNEDSDADTFAKRSDIAKKLRQWYDEYKKRPPTEHQNLKDPDDQSKHSFRPGQKPVYPETSLGKEQ
ncbi:MAG: hypothetical protein AB1599_09100 [Planctomycetota bacterium]